MRGIKEKMPYKSDLTGEIIINEDRMVTVTVFDSVNNEYVYRYLKDITELKQWWIAGKPHNGGKIEISSHKKEEIDDETQKITIEWNNQSFVFKDLAEVKDWYAAIQKSK
ncbi:hypothetical protein DRN97_06245 [Methanosarcinales archaeon]|nr:MAG: hypothetical protein DRN97_06245 [Methanosarcinales archaeon]